MRRCQALHLTCALILLTLASIISAQPVPVRYPEGTTHGFLILHDLSGKALAAGDLVQVVHGSRIVARLTFHFKDGSVDDETTTFGQRGTFRLISDRHIQKGPAFPKPIDLSVDVRSGHVLVRTEDNGRQQVINERMNIPAELCNGMLLYVMKNMATVLKEVKLPYLALTPKPRIVQLEITEQDKEPFEIANVRHDATRFAMKVELGGITGLVAPLVGKAPPAYNFWLLDGEAPAFIRMEGPLYAGGPTWVTEMGLPVWPKAVPIHQASHATH